MFASSWDPSFYYYLCLTTCTGCKSAAEALLGLQAPVGYLVEKGTVDVMSSSNSKKMRGFQWSNSHIFNSKNGGVGP
jgi:hypothetical protein